MGTEPLFMSRADGTRLLYILLKQARPGREAVQFVAAASGDGTSSVVRDLGLIAGGLGIRVLLVELAASRMEDGWSWLGDAAEEERLDTPDFSIRQVGPGGLHVCSWLGAPEAAPSRIAPLLAELHGRFDLILLDVAAFDRSADALLLAPSVFATVLVVATERSRVRALEDLRTQIAECGGSTLGMVLNRWRRHMPQFIEDRL